jgi:LacI family transcriptional regulator
MSIVRVANHAGVSTATVSRVLNNMPGVRAETVQQVRAALEALNYDPEKNRRFRRNGDATSILRARRRTNAIAIITVGQSRHWLQLPIMAASVAGISRGARELGLRVLLEEALDLDKPLPPSLHRQVDGAIVFMSRHVTGDAWQSVLTSIAQAMPTVWVMGGGGPGRASVDHIAPDNHAIGYIAYEYLKSRGCRDVAFLSKLPAWPVMRVRGQAFCSAAHDDAARCGMFLLSDDPRDGLMYGPEANVESDLAALLRRLAESQPTPTGLFISTDETTVSVYPELRRAGLRPGEDIHIVSCDNEQIRLSGLSPRPATIDIGAEEVGWRAVRRLMSRMNNPVEPPVLINVAPRLVEAETAAAAATAS